MSRATRKVARDWPAKRLLEMVVEVGSMSISTKGKNPNWTVLMATLVGIYRDESAKLRAIDNYNLQQQSSTTSTTGDEDDGE